MPLPQVCHYNSPHFNERPPTATVDLIVLHAISLPAGEFELPYVRDLFLGRLDPASHPAFADLAGLRVSAHFVIDRHGAIHQFVPIALRAWHAGISSWQGRENCNDFSLGIELVGDEQHPFTAAQYRECARLCRALMARYPAIDAGRIAGHSDIAPGRKWDPGRQWDWPRFRRTLPRIRHIDLEIA